MKTRFLFPRQFKTVGWLIFIPAIIAMFTLWIKDYDFDNVFHTKVFALVDQEILSSSRSVAVVVENDISDEIILCMLIIGGLFIGFSKLKNEDEFISKIRYESLVWAVYLNFAIMLLATIFIYGVYYFEVMIANMFTLLIFFIIRFHVILYKLKSANNEE